MSWLAPVPAENLFRSANYFLSVLVLVASVEAGLSTLLSTGLFFAVSNRLLAFRGFNSAVPLVSGFIMLGNGIVSSTRVEAGSFASTVGSQLTTNESVPTM